MDYPKVISKYITCEDQKDIKDYMSWLSRDHTEVLKRGKLADRIEREVVPFVRKLVRTGSKEWHHDLRTHEIKGLDRMLWPRSILLRSKVREIEEKANRDLREPSRDYLHGRTLRRSDFRSFVETLRENGVEYPLHTSTTVEFDTTGLDLSKGAGLPSRGTKKEHLEPALQYHRKIESDPTTPAYACLEGTRTQAGPPDTGKPRIFWMVPVSEWVSEVISCRKAQEKNVEAAHKPESNKDFHVAYCPPQDNWTYMFKMHNPEQYVTLDYEAWDWSVTAYQIVTFQDWLIADDYPLKERRIDYAIHAPLVTPSGVLSPEGVVHSGMLTTHPQNVGLVTQHNRYLLELQKLLRYLEGEQNNEQECIHVN